MTSLDDQIAVASKVCAAEGRPVAAIYSDAEKSGRNTRRPGFQALRTAIEHGEVDVVVFEAIDRLTRLISDALTNFDLMRFQQVELHSVAGGRQDVFRVLLAGMGAQLYSEMVGAHSVRAAKGGLTRGRLHMKAYGYRKVPGEQGLNREPDPATAPIVRRIFERFAEDHSAKRIAQDLNADRISSPTGGTWHSSTIRGNPKRGEGMLHNRLYTGLASICATTRTHHPDTGVKRVDLTPDEEVTAKFPELRIVPDDLWDRVQAELARRAETNAKHGNAAHARRARHLFSGLLACGTCGATYVRAGRSGYRCNESRKGACDNRRSISCRRLETRVSARLRAAFASNDLRASFAAALHAERKRPEVRDVHGEVTTLRTDLAQCKKGLDRILQSIEDGAPYALFRDETDRLNDEIASIEARIAELEPLRRSLAAPMPDAAALYDRALQEMTTLLGDPDLVDQANTYLRDLVTRIVLTPDGEAPHGMAVTLHVPLGGLLGQVADGGVHVENVGVEC